MKPFDLEAAKRGEPIVTRDGRKARFIAHVPNADERYRVVVLPEGCKHCMSLSEEGKYYSDCESNTDLFMALPPMCSINGHEYPEPVREPLEIGQRYWIPLPEEDELTYVDGFKWSGDQEDMVWLKRGFIQLTCEAAVAQARAIILAGGGEV